MREGTESGGGDTKACAFSGSRGRCGGRHKTVSTTTSSLLSRQPFNNEMTKMSFSVYSDCHVDGRMVIFARWQKKQLVMFCFSTVRSFC